MGLSLAKTWLHRVFPTKHQETLLDDEAVRARRHRDRAGICRKQKCPAMIVGGVSDHVHVLCLLSPNGTIQGLIRTVKRQSNVWLKKTWPHMTAFSWQKGYAVFSHSENHLDYEERYRRD
ncbi:transposase [Acanthopleuribacter pedis]|uniref:Transposase n=1 Tax=Acanthopleuribacter pedis TaxID=442870 RepID=A0A8J7U447_9BACT|nr:transposase [Acanthopleuribacter pedis]